MSKADNVPKDNKTGVVLGKPLETTLRYLAIKNEDRKVQDTIRRILLNDPDVIATAEEYGINLDSNSVVRGGSRHNKQDTPTIPQNEARTGIVEPEPPKPANKPALPHGAQSSGLSPAEILAQRRSGAAGKGLPAFGSNGKRRNGASAAEE